MCRHKGKLALHNGEQQLIPYIKISKSKGTPDCWRILSLRGVVKALFALCVGGTTAMCSRLPSRGLLDQTLTYAAQVQLLTNAAVC